MHVMNMKYPVKKLSQYTTRYTYVKNLAYNKPPII